jgi:hypothetical protein
MLLHCRVFESRNLNPPYNDTPPLPGSKWNIEHDGSFAEMFGYLKSLSIVFLFVSVPSVWKRPAYLAFLPVFTFLSVNDALQVHERLGVRIEEALALQRFDVLMRIDPGQLLVWATVGVPLLAVAVAAVVRSPEEDRRNGILLMGAGGAGAVRRRGRHGARGLKESLYGAQTTFSS